MKSCDEDSKYSLVIDQEPPVSRQFSLQNYGSATGFVKIVCLETLGQMEMEAQMIISPNYFLLKSGQTTNVTLTFGANYASSEASMALFCGSELVRHVYKKARKLPGAVRLSGSPALLGVDFTKDTGYASLTLILCFACVIAQ